MQYLSSVCPTSTHSCVGGFVLATLTEHGYNIYICIHLYCDLEDWKSYVHQWPSVLCAQLNGHRCCVHQWPSVLFAPMTIGAVCTNGHRLCMHQWLQCLLDSLTFVMVAVLTNNNYVESCCNL